MRIPKTILSAVLCVIGIGASALAFRPVVREDEQGRVRPLLEGAQIDPDTLAIVERSCQNCHSERTEWPWYSYLPPGSWLVRGDVHQARSQMDLSRWRAYSSTEKRTLLSAMGAASRTAVMPPRRYTLLHPKTALSAAERERLYRWAKEERLRLHMLEFLDRGPGDATSPLDRRPPPAP